MFGGSQGGKRLEDLRLLTGRVRIVDDVAPKGSLTALFLRAPHAHPRIRSIDTATAAAKGRRPRPRWCRR